MDWMAIVIGSFGIQPTVSSSSACCINHTPGVRSEGKASKADRLDPALKIRLTLLDPPFQDE